MKAKILFALFFLSTCSLLAQKIDKRIARTQTSLKDVQQIIMPPLDNEALLTAEMERREPGIAPRFAENIEVEISPATHGTWEVLDNGNSLWRLQIISHDAKSLNLGFIKFFMPDGGTLILYSPDYQRVMGPFTPSDNEEHEELWTPVLDGDRLVIEVQIPSHYQAFLELELKSVNHDFLGFNSVVSGSCNLDVICGEADGWGIVDGYRDIIQSVAVISTGGGTFCTGFLVNNANNDCTPFFMTANHCGINAGSAPSLVTFWNYQNSTCREPGSPASGANGDGNLSDFNTGSIFRAGYGPSDMTLVELDDPVSETANAFFAGWNAQDFSTTDTTIGVHHPSTDEKRISFEFDDTHVGDWPGAGMNANGDHIIVPDWDIGTTEGGSSGSPLFDNDKRVVGQLHGGGAACGNDDYDSYGWFHTSWEGGGSPSTRLKDWLDPDDTGILTLNGRSQMQCSFAVDATNNPQTLCAPADATYTINVSENFLDSVSLSITNVPGDATATFGATLVAPGESTTITISNTGSLSSGTFTMTVTGTDGTETASSELVFTVFEGVPGATELLEPANGFAGASTMPIYSWTGNGGTSYNIEVASDMDFTNIIDTQTGLNGGTYQSAVVLDIETTYFWRMTAENICGAGDLSEVYSFTTAAIFCSAVPSTDVGLPVGPDGGAITISTIEITSPGFIDDVNIIDVDVTHTWVGDLTVSITSPAGTEVILMNEVPTGSGECEGDDFMIDFDDEAANDYALLDATCNDSPAISGAFQPLNPLSVLNGESAQGTWTLTIIDNAFVDGGSLNAWSLDLCSTIPDDLSFSLSDTEFESCMDGQVSFSMVVGGAFDDSGVNLSANNLPAGATITFSDNPASPGSSVDVTIEGATEIGIFNIEIFGDDGINNGSSPLTWTIIGGPEASLLNTPLDGATGIGLTPTLLWGIANNANLYNLEVSTDPDFNNIIAVQTTPNQSEQIFGLDYGTTYYWRVFSTNDCGETVSSVFSFNTALDLSFVVSPSTASFCAGGSAQFTLAIGESFEGGGVNLALGGAPGGLSASFSNNPAAPGSNVIVVINAESSLAGGAYNLTISGNDGVNAVFEDISIIIEPIAPPANLTAPTNDETMVPVTPTFSWEVVADVNGYIFDLATDATFSTIIESGATAATSYDLINMLDYETNYCWRVTPQNDCGGEASITWCFTTEMENSVHEIAGVEINILPNPTQDWLYIELSAPLSGDIHLEVFSLNGRQLQQQQLDGNQLKYPIDLSTYPAGVYLVKLRNANSIITERIIVE